MQNGTGIQELMAAETRASQIVAEARIGEYLKEIYGPGFESELVIFCRGRSSCNSTTSSISSNQDFLYLNSNSILVIIFYQ